MASTLATSALAIHSMDALSEWYDTYLGRRLDSDLDATIYPMIQAAIVADYDRWNHRLDAMEAWLQSPQALLWDGWGYAKEVLGLAHALRPLTPPCLTPLGRFPDPVFHVVRERLVSNQQWQDAVLAMLTPLEKVFDFDPSGRLATQVRPVLDLFHWGWIERLPGLTTFSPEHHAWIERTPAPVPGMLVTIRTPGVQRFPDKTCLRKAWAVTA